MRAMRAPRRVAAAGRAAAALGGLVAAGTLLMAQPPPKAPQASRREIVRAGFDLGLPFSPAVKAGGLVYVSGTMATDERGAWVGGDIRAQTRRVLETMASVLRAAGSDLSHVLSVTVYLAQASDFAAMNEVYGTYFRVDPPARTTVVAGLVRPGALIEMSAVAVPRGGHREVVHPEGWARSPSPYSYAVRSDDAVFLAGLVARDAKTNAPVKGDVEAQVRAIMENARAILRAAGLGFEHVASARVFLTEAGAREAMNRVYREYFPSDPPARATVVTGLMSPDYLVEITFVASSSARRVVGDVRPGAVLSPGVQAGNRLYVSGMLGATEETRGDAMRQTREALARIGRVLEAGGFGWTDVAEATVYLTDVAHYAVMNAAYREVFPREFPARASVRTGLVDPNGLVEIMVTAAR
ncbi:MAG TPA: RidA family protein [Vicinamibacterales bacterium]|nr:RidA family protein [Vicinamibacterales bacterium]